MRSVSSAIGAMTHSQAVMADAGLHKRRGSHDVLRLMLDRAGEGRTMIVVTHDMSFAGEVCKRMPLLHQAGVKEAGLARHVRARPQDKRLRQSPAAGLP
jgi:ABC-type histidine transport system ATPase subunit